MARLAQALEGERAFATNAAHELRTPLAVALARVQRLRDRLQEPSSRTDAAEIEQALKRMSRLVARLLELARAQAGIGLADAPRDIVPLLEHVLEPYRRDPATGDLLHVTVAAPSMMCRIDPDAFAIVVGNLLENAFRHRLDDDAPVTVELSAARVLSVRNAARPRTAAQVEALARRFGRGEADGKGYGLGLFIAGMIARQSGGALHLSSVDRDGGAEFCAEFGLGPEPANDPPTG
jgi:two-component system OmpR family sensor kinase